MISTQKIPQLLLASAALAATPLAHATDYTWTNAASGAWTLGTAWSPTGTPGAADNIVGATAVGTLYLSGAQEINNFTFGDTGSWIVAANTAASALTVHGTLTVNGPGTLTIRPSGATFGLALQAANISVSSGVLGIGIASYPLTSLNVTGTMSLSGGTINNIAYQGSGFGTLNVTGGVLNLLQVSSGSSLNATASGLMGNGNGTINASTQGSSLVQLSISATSDYTSNVTLANGQAAARLSILKDGAGKQTLTGINTYTGTTTINGGTLSVSSLANGGVNSGIGASTNAASNLVLGGGTLEYTGAMVSTDRGYTLAAGTISGISVATANANLTIAGASAATTGGLTKLGSGTLTLSGQNLHSGTTTVSAGTLVIAGGGSLANGSVAVNAGKLVVNGSIGNGGVTVASGATLAGTGTIGGTTTVVGTHNPGNSPGVQTFENLTYQGGSSSVGWELGANTAVQSAPTASFDQIVVSGNLNFADATTLNLSFSSAGGSVDWTNAFWASNESWTIYSVSGVTTGFGELSLFTQNWADANGLLFNTARAGASFSLSQNGNDVVLNYSAVPEPRTTSLMAAGLLLTLAGARRAWRAAPLPRA